jgi:hypothetical protein
MPIRGSPNGAPSPPSTGGRDRPGMGGRGPSERVVAINWNEWSRSIGIAGRDQPVRAASQGPCQAFDGRSQAHPGMRERWWPEAVKARRHPAPARRPAPR